MIDRMGLGDVYGSASEISAALDTGMGPDPLGGAGSVSGDFQVDLPTVYAYYNKVYAVYMRLGDQIRELQQSPWANRCFNFGEIEGVAQAMNGAVNSAVGPVDSMVGAMMNAHAKLAKHLMAVSDSYKSYIEADNEHASTLNSAGASHVGYGGAGANPAHAGPGTPQISVAH